METKHLILTTVGITSLTKLNPNLLNIANANKTSLSANVKMEIDADIKKLVVKLNKMSIDERRRHSPELNGLYGYFNNDLSRQNKEDVHFLLATDTYLGKKSADTICDFLKEAHNINATVIFPKHLNTATQESFSDGIKNLIKWCEETIPGYKNNGYHVIFNLTAAFKSLQGYLNIIGMFYADEMIYIFENSDAILSIPSLPIQIDLDLIKRFSLEFCLMNENYLFPFKEVSGIPDAMIETIEEAGEKYASLSGWGNLIWNKSKRAVLSEELLSFPGLIYTDTFKEDFRNAHVDLRVRLQETLAQVEKILREHPEDSRFSGNQGLHFKQLENKKTANKEPINSFRVGRSYRVTCVRKGGKLLLLNFEDRKDVYN